MIDEELKKIIKDNRETLLDIDRRMHRIEKKFLWNSVFGFIKTLFILAPIIIGAVYFTPFLKDFVRIYEPIFKNLPITLENFSNVPNETKNPGSVVGETEFMLEAFCNEGSRQSMVEQLCK